MPDINTLTYLLIKCGTFMDGMSKLLAASTNFMGGGSTGEQTSGAPGVVATPWWQRPLRSHTISDDEQTNLTDGPS